MRYTFILKSFFNCFFTTTKNTRIYDFFLNFTTSKNGKNQLKRKTFTSKTPIFSASFWDEGMGKGRMGGKVEDKLHQYFSRTKNECVMINLFLTITSKKEQVWFIKNYSHTQWHLFIWKCLRFFKNLMQHWGGHCRVHTA